MHARSDLDLIVIYDPGDADMSEGRRPLATRPYYARLTQALITAMTVPMAEGRLYEVDMRLRPSGNQGPVATSLASYQTYQMNDAWVWEHLALTRARVVAGPRALAEDVHKVQSDVLSAPRDRDTILREVAKMRVRIADAKGEGDAWDAKLGQGRLQDIELIAQASALLAGRTLGTVTDALMAGAQCGVLSEADATALSDAYRLCWSLQIGSRLISDTTVFPEDGNGAGSQFLCRITGAGNATELRETLDEKTRQAAAIINAALPDVTDEDET